MSQVREPSGNTARGSNIEEMDMNILKVSCVEYSKSSKPSTYEVYTVDMNAEEFAELRVLLDLNRIMDKDTTTSENVEEKPKYTISVKTRDGMHKKSFSGELSDELRELIDDIILLSRVHADTLKLRSA